MMPQRPPFSILCVDDEASFLNMMEMVLLSANYRVSKAVDGTAALLQMQQEKPDLVLLDLRMPQLDGIETCASAKATPELEAIPIIIVTAQTDLDSIDKAFRAGARDYIFKPIRKIEVLARVRSVFRIKEEMERRQRYEVDLRIRNKEIEKALSEIKTLRGHLPICGTCKNIRTNKGYWEELEAYVASRTDSKFSHGICDECMKTQFSKIYGEKEGSRDKKKDKLDTGRSS